MDVFLDMACVYKRLQHPRKDMILKEVKLGQMAYGVGYMAIFLWDSYLNCCMQIWPLLALDPTSWFTATTFPFQGPSRLDT